MELFYFQTEGRREYTHMAHHHPLRIQVTHHKHLLEEPKKHSNIEIFITNTHSIQNWIDAWIDV